MVSDEWKGKMGIWKREYMKKKKKEIWENWSLRRKNIKEFFLAFFLSSVFSLFQFLVISPFKKKNVFNFILVYFKK